MTTTDITFPSHDGRPMRAAYAAPAGSRKRPGVIVIHEIFGLNDDIRRITGMVADLGYAALAPDLYDRDGARLICIARTLMTLNRGGATRSRTSTRRAKFLQQQPGVDSVANRTIGFCMGGGFARCSRRGRRWRPRRSMATCRRLPTSRRRMPRARRRPRRQDVRVAGAKARKAADRKRRRTRREGLRGTRATAS